MSLHTHKLVIAGTMLAAMVAVAAPAAAQRDRNTSAREPQRTTQSERQAQARRGAIQRPPSGANRSYRSTRQRVFSQPYYSFRPRLSLGFGLSVGYGVAYPFRYYDPSGFYNYRVRVLPGYGPRTYSTGYYSRVGGLSFDLDPYDADVFIDGDYVGVAEDFTPSQMPLTLPIGRHRVQLRAPGFRPVSFEVTVIGGRVIPYAGRLVFIR